MKREMAVMLMMLSFGVMVVVAQNATDNPTPPADYHVLYATHFASGIDDKLMQQKPRPESMLIVDAPGIPTVKVLRVSMDKNDDFSHIANGVPRAEISFGTRIRFQSGKEYLIDWSILIPADYVFDSKQPEGVTQLHEGIPRGSPPFGISLVGTHYQLDLRSTGDGPMAVEHIDLGDAKADQGKWVRWRLHYLPDATGNHAKLELFRNGSLVCERNGKPNAYANDNEAYFKIGIYKWWWKTKPSDVTNRTLFFGDVTIYGK